MKYCEPSDVSAVLRLISEDRFTGAITRLTFSSTTDPSIDEVNAWIEEASEYINRETNRSFQEASTTEMHTARLPYKNAGGSITINLDNTNCRRFDVEKGDRLEIHKMNGWEDVSEKSGWWMDEILGQIHFTYNAYLPYFFKYPRIREDTFKCRVTYRYGSDVIPAPIRRACALIVAKRIVEADWYRKAIPTQSSESIPPTAILQRWDAEIKKTIDIYTNYGIVSL